MSKKWYYIITFIVLLSMCITKIYSQNSQYVDKEGGICFRIDDNNDASKYYEYAEMFNRQNKKFTYALNLSKDQITTDYVEMIKSLQANGHEMLDHTPWHRTNYFSTELGTDYYNNHPGVSRINGTTIELKHKKVDINDSKRTGYVKIDGNIVTNSDGIFSNFSKTDCYLYFRSIDQLVFIDDRTGWIDEDTVIIRDIWRNSINLGFYDNI